MLTMLIKLTMLRMWRMLTMPPMLTMLAMLTMLTMLTMPFFSFLFNLQHLFRQRYLQYLTPNSPVTHVWAWYLLNTERPPLHRPLVEVCEWWRCHWLQSYGQRDLWWQEWEQATGRPVGPDSVGRMQRILSHVDPERMPPLTREELQRILPDMLFRASTNAHLPHVIPLPQVPLVVSPLPEPPVVSVSWQRALVSTGVVKSRGKWIPKPKL
jgi:hypothetical protein